MDQTLFSFLITTLAGLSTLIGSLIIFINNTNKDKIIISSLAFASSVMLLISITDLIPESYNMFKNHIKLYPLIVIILISINIGIIISLFIKKYIPENNNKLYRVGVISMLAIIMHNIPEGMATFMATNTNTKLGINLSIAIALHNNDIPILSINTLLGRAKMLDYETIIKYYALTCLAVRLLTTWA